MRNDDGLTVLSKNEIERLLDENISASNAYLYVSAGLKTRSFTEVISHYYKGDIKAGLTEGLPNLDSSIPRENIARKVRYWLADNHIPSEREELIKICFALGLSEVQSNSFLSVLSDGGFHLRSPRELAYAYSLRAGKTYNEAITLISGLKPFDNKSGERFALTKDVAGAFQNVRNDADFHRFYNEQFYNLGILHNTAYTRCMYFLDLLIAPSDPLFDEQNEKYSVDYVVEIYLRMNLPLERRTSDFTQLQKTIRSRWPNATSVVRVKNRSEDVTRRLLLLLYLVTEGAGTDESEYDEDMTERELFEEHYWRINSMLNDCGMSRLDPRGVFDWLILYGLKTSGDEAMSERLQRVLDIVFGNGNDLQ